MTLDDVEEEMTPRQLRRAYVKLLMDVRVGAKERTLQEEQQTHIRSIHCAFAMLYASPVLGFTPMFFGANKYVGLGIFSVCIMLYFGIMLLSSRRYTRLYQSAVKALEDDPNAAQLVEYYSR